MDKKSILISSVVIALAATMLFATIATPALAAKKTVDMVIPIEMYGISDSTCSPGGYMSVDGTFMMKGWDSGKMTTKLTVKVAFYDEGGEKTGTGHSKTSTIDNGGDLPIIIMSKVTTTCNGEGNVNNYHTIVVTVNGVDNVDFKLSKS